MSIERWLVCGGRKFDDDVFLDQRLGQIVIQRGRPRVVIHGAATGADTLAARWATSEGIFVIREPIVKYEWDEYGAAAGPRRNQRMIDLHHPTLVIAFSGGHGTADMVARARRAGIEIIEVTR